MLLRPVTTYSAMRDALGALLAGMDILFDLGAAQDYSQLRDFHEETTKKA